MMMMMMWNCCRSLLVLAMPVLLASCSDGGGSSVQPAATPTVTGQTFTVSATAGEILTYTIDTQAQTYSYKIVHSAYGLDNLTGSGSLVLNGDGSYSPTDAPNTKIYVLQNGLLMGTFTLDLGNGPTTVPIFGMSQPIASLDTLAGTYNFVGIQCTGQNTGCDSSYGTAQFDNVGNYTTCTSANLSQPSPSCTPSTTGSLGLFSDGVWPAIRSGSTNVNYLLAFAASNGQKVLIMDLNDPGGYGYGFIVMSTQAAYDQNLVDGTWYFQTNAGTGGSLVVAGPNISSSLGHTVSALFDAPWTGFASIIDGMSNSGVALLAGTGAYAYVNPDAPGYIELGVKN